VSGDEKNLPNTSSGTNSEHSLYSLSLYWLANNHTFMYKIMKLIILSMAILKTSV
jgi:hypothetical protein